MASPSPQILAVDPAAALPAAVLTTALAALRRGEHIVLPTDTVYGVAAYPRVPGALDRLYTLKGRPEDKPIARLGAERSHFEASGVVFNATATALAIRYWPGPLTLVLPSPDGSTGVRIPAYPVTLNLLHALGEPLAVTSANASGQPPSLTAHDAVQALGSEVSLVLDAGPSPGPESSTVVRVLDNGLEVLREGVIPSSDILAFQHRHEV